jgi:hypothetical protein
MPNVLNIASLGGVPFLAWGLAALDIWPTLLGLFLMVGSKLWYIDRMAILYEDMVFEHPDMRYRRLMVPS